MRCSPAAPVRLTRAKGSVHQYGVLPRREARAAPHRERVLADAAVGIDVAQVVHHQHRGGERADRGARDAARAALTVPACR